MVFSSTIFIFLFLPICLTGYYLINPKYQNVFLLIMSLLFYAWGEPQFVLVLIISIFLNYWFAIFISKNMNSPIKNIFVVLMLVYNLGVLFVFKYLNFAIGSINTITGARLMIPGIALPIGISFFTFQAISYVLDVAFGKVKEQKNILNLALYIAFFPQLIAGPIVRYNSIEEQINNRASTLELFAEGVKRFVVGLSKKIILSNMIATLSDTVFAMQYEQRTILMAWMGVIAYCLQLYFDFSGYSDMAIGLGKMFGFSFEENFNYPYISKSIVEYWSRWHISLGQWLRDYLYTPVFRSVIDKKNIITKNKIGLAGADLTALFITWIFAGIWHGAGWNYILYGLYYFAFIALERQIESYQKRRRKRLKIKKKVNDTVFQSVLKHLYTLFVVCFGQLLFKSSSVHDALYSIKAMFGGYGNSILDIQTVRVLREYRILLPLCIILCTPIIQALSTQVRKKLYRYNVISCLNVVSQLIYIALFVVAVSYTVTSTYNPFIYFNF